MMVYRIDFKGNARPPEYVDAGEAVRRIDELSGRAIGDYIMRVAIRRRGRAYVATRGKRPPFTIAEHHEQRSLGV